MRAGAQGCPRIRMVACVPVWVCGKDATTHICDSSGIPLGVKDLIKVPFYTSRCCGRERYCKTLLKHAYENKDYPPKWNNVALCRAYHIKGECPRGSNCPFKDTHRFIDDKTYFKQLMAWSHSILNPNNKNENNQQATTPPSTVTPTASDTEESKE